MLFSAIVNRVIELATAIRDYWDAELPKRYAKYPLVQPGEEDGPPPPEEAELRDLLRSLPPEYVYKLLALTDVGRRVCPASAFHDRSRFIADDRGDVEWAISRMVGYPPLADGLQDGLEALSATGIDIDANEPSPV